LFVLEIIIKLMSYYPVINFSFKIYHNLKNLLRDSRYSKRALDYLSKVLPISKI